MIIPAQPGFAVCFLDAAFDDCYERFDVIAWDLSNPKHPVPITTQGPVGTLCDIGGMSTWLENPRGERYEIRSEDLEGNGKRQLRIIDATTRLCSEFFGRSAS